VYLPKLYSRIPQIFSIYFELIKAKSKLKNKEDNTRLTIYNDLLPKIEEILKSVSPVLLPKFSSKVKYRSRDKFSSNAKCGSKAECKNLFIYLFTYFSKPEMPHYALKQKEAYLYTYDFDDKYRRKRNGRPRSVILYREIPLRRRER
jgi:hypothetical protein